MFYEVVKQGAIFCGFIGAVCLVHHFAGQIREGSASGWSLVAGCGLPVVGLLFWMLADIGSRLPPPRDHSDGDS